MPELSSLKILKGSFISSQDVSVSGSGGFQCRVRVGVGRLQVAKLRASAKRQKLNRDVQT